MMFRLIAIIFLFPNLVGSFFLWQELFDQLGLNQNSFGQTDTQIKNEKTMLLANPNGFTFNKSKLSRLSEPMLMDIGVFVDQSLISYYNLTLESMKNILNLIFFDIGQIASMSNIEFNVRELEKIDLLSQNFKSYKTMFAAVEQILMKKQSIAKMYTFLIPELKLTDNDYRYAKEFCTLSSIMIIPFPQDAFYNRKLFAELLFDILLYKTLLPANLRTSCNCPYNYSILCIGLERVIYTSDNWPPKALADCYVNFIDEARYEQKCLFEKQTGVRLFSKCGDGVVDDDEDCDCGHELLCKETGQDKCCDMRTCRYKNPAFQCTKGMCCENCFFKNRTICRKSFGECDLAEYCDEKSAECPADSVEDHYKMCNQYTGFCLNGMCMNHNSLCSYIYRSESVYFEERCYSIVMDHLFSMCNKDRRDPILKELCPYQNPCQYLICGTKKLYPPDNVHAIHNGAISCLIPYIDMKKGSMAHAPNYMPCSSQNEFCYDGVCTAKKNLLKNCVNENCYYINNNMSFDISKKIPIDNYGCYFRAGIHEVITPPLVRKLFIIPIVLLLLIFSILVIFGIYIYYRRNKGGLYRARFSSSKLVTE